ncbi:hypothetical protein RMN57_15385 [Kitasatospora sp. CM 4170]|uniref:Uncharacterized protein n=1 Tax=Kitasatospora aburaviensis TaxID=67265 RepID=A0ABW1ESN6_9ACTN|nr:hypothetical protein [Kitasatospora sp. CM 4170]WNM45990.1 hypothetical protein RMN57_15385 [Kitasatospora sp. CM 4170]
MATGTGSTGGGGNGYRVEVEQLRAFAAQVRLLLAEFQRHADGTTTHGQSAVGKSSFGTFAEATELHNRYQAMRDGLRDVLNQLQEAVDDAQKRAELTATNYEEQEHRTSGKLKLGDDGWSVATPSATSTAAYAQTVAPARHHGGKSER